MAEMLLERSKSQGWLLLGLIIAVCGIVVLVDLPALSAEGVFFDDEDYFLKNKLVQNPSWESAKRFLTEVLEPSTIGGYYQPLAMISLMIDYGLGGRPENLRNVHRTSVILHVCNTALIILLIYVLFGGAWVAAGVGLLFGLHPMTVESICWVGDRKTLLAAFFAMWCMLLFVEFVRKKSYWFYGGAMAAYVLALMSKPTSVPVPALLLLMDYWPLKRISRKTVIEKVPFFVLALGSAVITYVSQDRTAVTQLAGGYGARVLFAVSHNIVFYLYKIVWPFDVSPYYAYPQPLGLSDGMVLAGLIGTIILIIFLVVSLRWTRAFATGWLIFFIAVFPTIGIVRFTAVIAANRFIYLPSVGLLILLGAFGIWFCYPQSRKFLILKRVLLVILVAIVALGEVVKTREQIGYWVDTEALHKYMLTLTPNEPGLHYNLGNDLKLNRKNDEAIYHYREALKYDPNSFGAHNNLATMLAERSKYDEAMWHLGHVLRIKPDYPDGYFNMGLALSSQERREEAIRYYQQALVIKPDYVDAHINLAGVFSELNNTSEAIGHYNKALNLEPDNAIAHNNLANALIRVGRADESIERFREALRLKPDWVVPMQNLSRLLVMRKDRTVSETNEAISYAERAVVVTKRLDAYVLQTLANVYASAGRYDFALTTAQEALMLASGIVDKQLSNELRQQIEYYRKKAQGKREK